MRLDGVQAQSQQCGDLLVGLPFRQHLHHLALAEGQQLITVFYSQLLEPPHVVIHQHAADLRAEERFPGGDGANGVDDVRLRGILQQIAPRTGLQGLEHISFIGVHAQNDHLGLRQMRRDLTAGIDAVQLRHRNVQQHHVGPQFHGKIDRLASIRGLGHHLHIRLAFEQVSKAAANDRVIVGDQYSYRWHTT